jgi:hypothetical protein
MGPQIDPSRAKTKVAAIALITLAGAALRVAAARGDLWLDEIWTLRLVDTVPTLSDVALALPYDNNHVLNSLWLKIVGDAAPPLLARLPAILFGVLCAPAAAWGLARRGRIASMAAAAVFALDYAFVHYGSEARGYSGLILAVLVSLGALERVLAGENPRRNRLVLALAIAFGTFSHLTMVEATALLCAAALARSIQAEGWRVAALAKTGPIFGAAAAGSAPALACGAISLAPGTLHTGLVTPFTGPVFAEGLGRMARATIGLPDTPNDPVATALLLLGVGACVVVMLAVVPRERRVFPALAILALPALHATLRLPNQQYPRFFLAAAIALAILAAEVFSRGLARGGVTRWGAIALGLAFFVGQGVNLAAFLDVGRGHYAEAAAFLRAKGPARFAVLPTPLAGETNAVIRWYGAGPPEPSFVADAAAICRMPPDWLIVVHAPNEAPDTQTRGIDGAPCPLRFAHAKSFPAYGLSGFTWTIFPRID